ncbi:glycoside hydrolase family 9 protein [Aureibaculum luteum]|uniref:glycoside hydrolase family 9 protein n=1 Tax=Aureibaculum luteum TaxID=1548456 RepID=UPI000E4CB26D|nr:glycoside hydrolase family 9 protein [Aureibaculum luteum]
MKYYILVVFISISFLMQSQTLSKYIVVDQFGYRPDSEKIAVMRDPVTGFDAAESFSPGVQYALVNANNGATVYTGNIVSFNSGLVDPSSGDRAWWFDFSSYQTPGIYYILDVTKNLKSYDFVINDNVYEEVLKHAFRTFFYQRAGYSKGVQYAGAKWSDGASHLATLQDSQCRKFDTPNDASSQKDLSGGWYDAGDYNKYTSWTANYIVSLLKAYKKNPDAWGDNYNLPYSGNGIPDLIDEVKWGLDYLLKLQKTNGSMISVVSLSQASPPSSTTGRSLYGGVNTSGTLASAAAFAYGAKVFNEMGMTVYGADLLQSATNAWNWADNNPNVVWENNSASYNSVGIGAGQQETNDYGRLAFKVKAATYLFDLTNNVSYKTFVENNYQDIHLMLWNFAFPFEHEDQESLLYYASLTGVSSIVANAIKNIYKNAMQSSRNFGGLTNELDPYLAHLEDYVWGSNGTKSKKGLMFSDYVGYNIDNTNNEDALRAAELYLHYLHGVNPLNFCYLSNMYDYGADNGVNEFYHAWFADGTDWDNVQNDPKGPAPGFLTGGPNPSYDWDDCCSSGGCSGQTCNTAQVSRIKGQPKQKAYDDFNTTWPMNSWEVTENSNGYQVAYISLLSQFVAKSGSLSVNENEVNSLNIKYFPNPFHAELNIEASENFSYTFYDLTGRAISSGNCDAHCKINEVAVIIGIYLLKIKTLYGSKILKLIKQ